MKGVLVSLAAFIAAGASELRAQFIWTGDGTNGDVRDPYNWQGGTAPQGLGSEDISFPYSGTFNPLLPVSLGVRNITFGAASGSYLISGRGTLTLTGSVSSTYEGGASITIEAPVSLASGLHTITVGTSDSFGTPIVLLGALSGAGGFSKWGLGELTIDHEGNTFSGGVELDRGVLRVHGDGALGTGAVYMYNGKLVALDTHLDSLTTVLANDFYVSSLAKFGEIGGRGSLTLTGPINLQTGVHITEIYTLGRGLLTLADLVEHDEGTILDFAGEGMVRIAGYADYSGDTHAEGNAAVIFAHGPPSTGYLIAHDDSYIGTEETTNIQSSFLSRVHRTNSIGIVGFDTADLETPAVVSELIDLSVFDGSLRVGTSTAAIFKGTIIPGSYGYHFGGRGTLTVESSLTYETGLEATSGLLLFLKGANSYAGPTRAGAGAAIVFTGDALPNGTAFNVEAGSYIGYTETTTDLSVSAFLRHFNTGSTFGVIGFDTENPSGRIVNAAINLSGFSSSVYLGTATQATLTGLITPAGTDYRFTGFRNGQLTVGTALSGSGAVYVGQDQADVFWYAPGGVTYSPSVTLTGSNSYTGGTYLQSGRLLVGNASALGTGVLHLTNDGIDVGLESTIQGLSISNPIVFENYASLALGGGNDFTLFGVLNSSADGRLDKIGTSTVTLAGDNSTLAAAISVHSGTLCLAATYAAGTGPVSLFNFDGVNDGRLQVNFASAYVHGLTGENQTSVTLQYGNLVVDQNIATEFAGEINGIGALIKLGDGTLTLTGASSYSDATEIDGGTVSVKGGSITHASGDVSLAFNPGDEAQLEIIDGGIVSDRNAWIAYGIGSRGSVRVSGAGSTWNNSNNLNIGYGGDGYLEIRSGGAVASYAGYVGLNGDGSVSVSGPDSAWTATDEIIVGAPGSARDGTMSIQDGGAVTSGRASIGYIGRGDVLVEGSGSHWHSSGFLNVGSSGGEGTLVVTSGGIVSSVTGVVGLDSGYGYVVITGANSAWDLTSGLQVGVNTGVGNLMIMDDAFLNVANGIGTITIGSNYGTGALILGQSEDGVRAGVVNAGTITGGGSGGQLQLATAASSTLPYFLTKDGTAGGSPVALTGSLAVLNFEGYNVLSGTNTYTGGTYLNGGTLVAASNGALGTGTIQFQGGRLSVASGVTLSNPLSLTSGGVLGGNGTIGSAVTVGTGVELAPGNSVGLLNFSSGTTWGPGGTYDIEIQSALGSRGVGYDSITVTGGLTFTATLGSPFTFNLISLDVGGSPGAVSDFNPASGYSWLIAQTDGLTGFNVANLQISTANFTNNLGAGAFSVSTTGNNVYLNFSPVPEPATWILLVLGLGVLGVTVSARRRVLADRR